MHINPTCARSLSFSPPLLSLAPLVLVVPVFSVSFRLLRPLYLCFLLYLVLFITSPSAPVAEPLRLPLLSRSFSFSCSSCHPPLVSIASSLLSFFDLHPTLGSLLSCRPPCQLCSPFSAFFFQVPQSHPLHLIKVSSTSLRNPNLFFSYSFTTGPSSLSDYSCPFCPLPTIATVCSLPSCLAFLLLQKFLPVARPPASLLPLDV